ATSLVIDLRTRAPADLRTRGPPTADRGPRTADARNDKVIPMGVRTLSHADRMALEELDARLKTILPEEYQASYEGMEPVPMRSAGLKYDSDGKVAWNEIWGSFCDLAMAGGPPHRGSLLGPGR